jgi:hypothetical protein
LLIPKPFIGTVVSVAGFAIAGGMAFGQMATGIRDQAL